MINLLILYAQEPVIIIVGPPGSGKGQFSEYCVAQYHYDHISAGDLLRFEVQKQTEIGKQIEPILNQGKPVPSPIMYSILQKRIKEMKGKPFIIDGFGGQDKQDVPFLFQTLSQEGRAQSTYAFFFETSDEVCIQRMSYRQVCERCAKIFNTQSLPSTQKEQCDHCGSTLIQRPQDTTETIMKRLEWYRRHMTPNYHQIRQYCPFIVFDANGSLDNLMKFCQRLPETLKSMTTVNKSEAQTSLTK